MRSIASAAIAIAVLLAPAASWARDITAQERSSLAEVVAGFGRAISSGDHGAVLDYMPPGLLDAIADSAGAPRADFRAAMIQGMDETMKVAQILDFSMDVATLKAREGADGEPYALIPTRTLVQVRDRKAETLTDTVAVLVKGKWHLVRISNATQAAMLIKSYPNLKNLEVTVARTKVIQ